MPKQSDTNNERLTKRTIQILGWVGATALTVFKLAVPDSDVPWWVIFGLIGVGISAEIDIVDILGRK
jgi:hypothetical protein